MADFLQVETFLLGERLSLKEMKGWTRAALTPLMLKSPSGGHVAVFRYGALVLMGLTPSEQEQLLEEASAQTAHPYPTPFLGEELFVRVEGKEDTMTSAGILHLSNLNVVKLQALAIVLADSAMLRYYERKAKDIFNQLEPMAEALKRTGTASLYSRELLKKAGEVLLGMNTLVGRVEVSEKPDVVWDNPGLERLFQRLSDEYEVKERQESLNRKFQVASHLLDSLLDLERHSHSAKLDWAIVFMIALAISVMVYGIYF